MISFETLKALVTIVLFYGVCVSGQSQQQQQLTPAFEQRVRGLCRSLNLGSICDADIKQLCQQPQLSWICQRQGRGGSREKGTRTPTAATPAPGPAITSAPTGGRFTQAGTAAPATDHTRHPRRKHTTRPTQAPVTEKHQPTESPIGKKFVLTPEQIATLQANCAKKQGGCQGQSAKAAETKKHVSNSIVQDLIKGKKVASEAEALQKAQEILDATQEAKRTLYDVQGIPGIEPDDDGLWNKDMRLNLEQAKYIQNEVSGVNSAPTAIPQQVKSGRDKRFSVFLESFPVSKWNMPIGYVVGSDLTADQGSQVRAAIAEIERKTCIKFYEDTRTPPTTPYILYQAYLSGSYCGQSPIGNQGGVNSVWLNFNCDSGRIKATIIHETLHSLGIHHEHVRVDRDDWITVDWNNIDPQSYDLFDGRPYINSYTSYGVPYDYYSVMHYHPYVASLDGRANMIPKYFPEIMTKKLGQRQGLSDKDAEKLRKMYCEPDCTDYHVWCGYWSNKNYCLDTRYFDYMKRTCGKSCGWCPDAANA